LVSTHPSDDSSSFPSLHSSEQTTDMPSKSHSQQSRQNTLNPTSILSEEIFS
jgi:hypothetical protein